MKAVFGLFILLVLLSAPYALDISACQVLDAPNTAYNLLADARFAGNCFNVTADNVTLDCQNHVLSTSYWPNSVGVYINRSNATILNCDIYSFNYGIYLDSAPNATLINNSPHNNQYGVYSVLSDNFTLRNNIIFDNSWGVHLSVSQNGNISDNNISSNYDFDLETDSASCGNIISNNTGTEGKPIGFFNYPLNLSDNDSFSEIVLCGANYSNLTNVSISNLRTNGYNGNNGLLLSGTSFARIINSNFTNDYNGIRLWYSSNNSITNNYLGNNTHSALTVDTSSHYNNINSNLFSENHNFGMEVYDDLNNLSSNTFIDTGIYDYYTVYACANEVQNNTGSGGRRLLYFNESLNLENQDNISELVLCAADNSNLTNLSVQGSDHVRDNGILITDTLNAFVTNCTSANNSRGIHVHMGGFNTLFNNTANYSGIGVEIEFSQSNTVASNQIMRGDGGIQIHSTSINNTVENNTITSSIFGIYVYTYSSNNRIRLNNVTNSSAYGLDVGYQSVSNNITDNIVNESANRDLYVDPQTACNNNITNNTGSGNRKILFFNSSVIYSDDANISELLLCQADYSNLSRLTVHGSDLIENNGIFLQYTSSSNLSDSCSLNNYYPFYLEQSSNNTLLSNNGSNSNSSHIVLTIYSGDYNQVLSNRFSGVGIGANLQTISWNRLENNTLDSLARNALQLSGSGNNTLIANNITSPQGMGLSLGSSSDNNITNNNVLAHSSAFYLGYSCQGNRIDNNSLNSTGSNSISLYRASTNLILNNSMRSYSNSWVINSNSDSGNNTFWNNTLISDNWIYDINGTNFYNLSTIGNAYYSADGTPSWGQYAIYDLDGDNWSDIGSDLPFRYLSVFPHWSGFGNDSHPYTLNVGLTGCFNLSSANTAYGLFANLTGIFGTCFNATAENASLDGFGNYVWGDNSSDHFAVHSNFTNTTITNLEIQNFSTGIFINGSTAGYANLTNNTINITFSSGCDSGSVCGHDIMINESAFAEISNNVVYSDLGAIVLLASNNSTIDHNNATAIGMNSIELNSSHNCLVQYNIVIADASAITSDFGSNNLFQYNHVAAPVFALALYNESNDKAQFNDLTASTNIGLSIHYNSNTILQYNNVTTPQIAIEVVNSSGSFVYHNNATASVAYAVNLVSSTNSTVQDNDISSPIIAIYLSGSSNNTVQYNRANATAQTIDLDPESNNNTIQHNTATAVDDYAVYLTTALNNTFFNNTLKAGNSINPRTVIYTPDASSGLNLFYYNNITGFVWVNNANDTNSFTSGGTGNIYYLQDSTPSWSAYSILDNGGDTWADLGSNYPFSASTVPTRWIGLSSDTHPFTTVRYAPPAPGGGSGGGSSGGGFIGNPVPAKNNTTSENVNSNANSAPYGGGHVNNSTNFTKPAPEPVPENGGNETPPANLTPPAPLYIQPAPPKPPAPKIEPKADYGPCCLSLFLIGLLLLLLLVMLRRRKKKEAEGNSPGGKSLTDLVGTTGPGEAHAGGLAPPPAPQSTSNSPAADPVNAMADAPIFGPVTVQTTPESGGTVEIFVKSPAKPARKPRVKHARAEPTRSRHAKKPAPRRARSAPKKPARRSLKRK